MVFSSLRLKFTSSHDLMTTDDPEPAGIARWEGIYYTLTAENRSASEPE
jgi:hypothetical protein